MHQIISFLSRYRFLLLFLFLQVIALGFTINSHSYHKSKFINSSNIITGYIYSKFNVVEKRQNLKEHNNELFEENIKLKKLLSLKNNNRASKSITIIDSIYFNQKYSYTNAKIINNDYIKTNNFITIDKGSENLVVKDLGVINNKGVIGIISKSSNYYATVMSILNENTKINGRLKKNNHYGSISWNGKDYRVVQLEDIPRQANLKIGDTIITGGRSHIFPEGVLIGKIKDYELLNNNYNTINVELFNDMSAIRYVNIVTNLEKSEIEALEQTNE